MLRNTWESQNARAATLQDSAFELEQELGAMRVQYAAAVASLQVFPSSLILPDNNIHDPPPPPPPPPPARWPKCMLMPVSSL